ncbi:MAG: hypothetical protein US62_C0006G0014 [Candidatus Woesebacteria bacterium GW2011_GWA1_37_8]|uniref:DUF5667 domain-containing protein n=1 Tax=Candidatus Woesebacteria bacterium GW2011_GWA1_37_8 TaxID=1618546 RepID=A0A0G0HS65_9BACT|nr:MAG: hypothetical protein US39_C0004G0038 [Microgenomates group bacterium GW2011_GWC1_37_12b]KKQ46003.1 MAG: hypothetical protein US62_C0006G0014 [Candidatus Woesebacteria bacterium GW2011_GWA1_37_8]
MVISRVLISIVAVFFVTSFFPKVVYGEYQLKQQKINPGGTLYKLKRVRERAQELFIFSSKSKVKYHINLVDDRISELGYIIDKKVTNEIEKSSSRLSFEIQVAQEIMSESGNFEPKDDLKTKCNDILSVLPSLRDKYPAQSSGWLLVQQNIDVASACRSI